MERARQVCAAVANCDAAQHGKGIGNLFVLGTQGWLVYVVAGPGIGPHRAAIAVWMNKSCVFIFISSLYLVAAESTLTPTKSKG
jgi:hypothetical protein